MNDLLLKLWFKAKTIREEHGQDMVEYALVVGIIALGATAAIGNVATTISTMFETLNTAIQTQASKMPK